MHARCLFVAALAACGQAPPPKPAAPSGPPPGTTPTELIVGETDHDRDNPRFLADRIYPIARSDNQIAYVYVPADEACGCYNIEVRVQDLKTGAIVWKDRYESGELHAEDTAQLRTLDEVWRARGMAWERKIRELGLAREATPLLQPVSKFVITPKIVGEDSPLGYAHIESYQIDALAANGSAVPIDRAKPPGGVLDVHVPGYLKPHGKGPAAVVIVDDLRGYEGPPDVLEIRIVGAVLP